MPHATPTARKDAGLSRTEREAETVRLARIAQASERGSREWVEARNRIVELNVALSRCIAKRYVAIGYREESDLVQSGCLGLMTAADRFDPDRGAMFSTFAAHWIHHYIRRFRKNCGSVIRVPHHAKNADGTDCQDYVLMPLTEASECVLSKDNDETARFDDREHGRAVLSILRDKLQPRDYEILSLRFGLDGNDPETLTKIAKRYGIATQGIQQRIPVALVYARKYLKLYLDPMEDVA